jgi:RNA polymerase sigma-70 factor, ECF subfamily
MAPRRVPPVALVDVPHDLIESCRAGDREAVEELIRLVSPDLYRIIFSILRDHDETDEVLQETLIRLFRYIGALKDVSRFPAWVMRIATNQVQTYRARRGRSRLYEVENPEEISNSAIVLSGAPPEDARGRLMSEQIREEISAAMETLPTRQRMATVLFEVEGMSIREIAHALECSEGAVKFNIHEGRKKLKKQLAHLVREKRWGRSSPDIETDEPAKPTGDKHSGRTRRPAADRDQDASSPGA